MNAFDTGTPQLAPSGSGKIEVGFGLPIDEHGRVADGDHSAGDIPTDLIAARPDRGPDPGFELIGWFARIFESLLNDLSSEASPARMNDSQAPLSSHDDRETVGGGDRQGQSTVGGGQCIGFAAKAWLPSFGDHCRVDLVRPAELEVGSVNDFVERFSALGFWPFADKDDAGVICLQRPGVEASSETRRGVLGCQHDVGGGVSDFISARRSEVTDPDTAFR